MAAHRTARALAREKITADIIDEGRRQLAEHGAAGLSLRSVARELGMVSSAVYRSVANRDDLLTRLIVEAYDSLGDSVDASIASSVDQAPLDRWVLVAHAVRDWAIDRPHEYFLVFGTPVPGYAAPETTTATGTRTPRALTGIVAEALATKQVKQSRGRAGTAMSPELADDFAKLRTNLDRSTGFNDELALAIVTGWTQMFGLLSFELSNQTKGVVEHHRDLFDSSARLMAAQIGLADSD
jgi:AcrR family transcriptional regulator